MLGNFAGMDEAEKLRLDDMLAVREREWWNGFYQDRARPCPFFVTHPDENLVNWLRGGVIAPGRVLELGCGNGRNAIFLAREGFSVDAVDYAGVAIEWARQRAHEAGAAVRLQHSSVFDLRVEPNSYDLVYDSGCFHHIAPHRRSQYVALVSQALRPQAWFGMVCFRPEGGSGLTDDEVYSRRTLGGGLGYTEAQLSEIWCPDLVVRSIRQMAKPSADSGLFGETFLWTVLAQKP